MEQAAGLEALRGLRQRVKAADLLRDRGLYENMFGRASHSGGV